MSGARRRIARRTLLVVAILVIVLGTMLAAARLLFPWVSEYRESVEAWASEAVGAPVEVRELDARWRGLHPEIRLIDVRLLDPETGDEALRLEELWLSVDVVASLRARTVEAADVRLVGARLELRRDLEGNVRVVGLGRDPTDPVAAPPGWLLGEGERSLRDSELIWRDERYPDAPLRLTNVNVDVRTEAGTHRLRLGATVPGDVDGTLYGEGTVASGGERHDWEGRFQLQGAGVPLGAWLGVPGGARLDGGVAGMDVTAVWQGGRLARVQGDVEARQLAWSGARGETPVPESLAADARWRRGDAGWTLDVPHARVATTDTAAQMESVRVALRDDRDAVSVDGRLAATDLEWMAPVAALLGPVAEDAAAALTGMAPRGRISEAMFEGTWRGGGLDAYRLEGRLQGGELARWRDWPGARGVEGRFRADRDGGHLDLDSEALILDFGDLFAQPLAAAARGRLSWRRVGDDWQIEGEALRVANADASAAGRFQLQLGERPEIDLAVDFDNADVARVADYMPLRVVPDAVVRWLDEALVSGRAGDGEVVLKGALDAFPYHGDDGVFRADFRVVDAELAYLGDWPVIRGLSADVTFAGPGLEVVADGGRIYDADIAGTRMTIGDLTDATLRLDGAAVGPADDFVRLLREAPLFDRARPPPRLNAHGTAGLDLDLLVPLTDPAGTTVSGEVTLEDVDLSYPPWDAALEAVNGRVAFSEARPVSGTLTGRFEEQPLEARLERATLDGARPGTRLTVNTHLAVNQLLAAAPDAIRDRLGWYFSGQSDWSVTVAWPREGVDGAQLTLESDLTGTTVHLPRPLDKDQEEPRSMRVHAEVAGPDDLTVAVTMGGLVDSRLALQRGADGHWSPTAGEVVLGGEAARLRADRPGITLRGRISHLSVPAWREVAAGADEDAVAVEGPTGDVMRRIDLRVGEVEALGRRFHDTHIDVARDGDRWSGSLSSDEFSGQVAFPAVAGAGPLALDLDRLRVTPAVGAAEDGEWPDPRDLPSMDITVERFFLGDIEFGRLELMASSRDDGWNLDSLVVASERLELDATGRWTSDAGGGQRSTLDARLAADDLGALLEALGYTAAVERGRTTAELQVAWPGPFTAVAWSDLDGTLTFGSRDGQLRDVEPGAGRAFGLLSLQALPRRLALDFGDLFRRGFAYDRMEGEFEFADGKAETQSFVLDGPAAHVRLTGMIDLDRREYDQVATVQPRLTGALPLVGALAGGPGVGVALWATQQLLQGRLDEAVGHRYAIRGSWDDPVVERLGRHDVDPLEPAHEAPSPLE